AASPASPTSSTTGIGTRAAIARPRRRWPPSCAIGAGSPPAPARGRADIIAGSAEPGRPRRRSRLRVAITGVAGFVGSNLAEALLARGDEVAGLDDLSHGTLDNLSAMSSHARFRFHRGTILDARDLAEIAKGPDALG